MKLLCKSKQVCRSSLRLMGQERGLSHSADIVISGGGMVGAACALALARLPVNSDKKIILLEGSPKKKINISSDYSNRVVALNPGSVDMLKQVGAWSTIQQYRYNPVLSMRVWDACSDAAITFKNDDPAQPLSYIIENDLVQKGLNEQMDETSNIEVINGARVDDYQFPELKDKESLPEEKVVIRLASGDELTTDLLVGADGFKSLVRTKLNVDSVGWEYNYTGVVATLKFQHEIQENSTAYQRFLPTGPVAVLPLNSSHSSLVWSMPTELAKKKIQLPEEQFVEELNSALRTDAHQNELVNTVSKGLNLVLDGFKPNKSDSVPKLPPLIIGAKNRAGFPLGLTHSHRYVGPRTVLVGDAAHRVHPLAGQGVNLGFGDILSLADVVEKCLMNGSPLGERSYLLEYETQRQRHNVPTMFSIDSLHRLYTTTLPPVVLARSLGLQITDAMQPLKKIIMGHAAS